MARPSVEKLKRDLEEQGCTPFQIEVLLKTAQIPRGETRSYSEIANAIGRPKATRAVGSALRRNPYPGERVPCHRVIHKSGRIEGYMGSLDPDSIENKKKRRLLEREIESQSQN
ncbi:MAG: MGMT family protein [Bdellovibrionales bacterium]|nr:MGMT family protein [Bdellovibrionales bacterium]